MNKIGKLKFNTNTDHFLMMIMFATVAAFIGIIIYSTFFYTAVG